jgi:hypothetical protein
MHNNTNSFNDGVSVYEVNFLMMAVSTTEKRPNMT